MFCLRPNLSSRRTVAQPALVFCVTKMEKFCHRRSSSEQSRKDIRMLTKSTHKFDAVYWIYFFETKSDHDVLVRF